MRKVFSAAKPSRWRRILIIVAVVLLLAIAIGAYLVATFDANAHKARFASFVKEKTGRELSIPGAVRLHLFPKVRLELDRATLNEKNSSAPFATIEAVTVALRPWPLLHQRLEMDQIEIGNFNLTLKRFANGATNFDDLIAKNDSPSALRFDLAGLVVKNGALQFDDQLLKRKTDLTGIRLTSGRIVENVVTPISTSFLLTNDNPNARLQTEIGGDLNFDLRNKRYVFNRIKIKASGTSAVANPLSIGLQGNIDGDLQAGRFALQALNAVIDGRAGAQTFHGQVAAPKISLTPNEISAPDFKLDFGLEQGTMRSTGNLIGAMNFDVTQQRITVPALTLSTKINRDKTMVEADAAGPLTINLQSGDVDALHLNGNWSMRNDHDQLAGKWRAPIAANIADGNFAIDSIQVQGSGQFADAQFEANVLVPMQGNWREAHAQIPSINFKSSMKWRENALQANIRADLEASSARDQIIATSLTIDAHGENANGKWQAKISSPATIDFSKQLATLSNLIGQAGWSGASKSLRPLNVKLSGVGNVDLALEQARFKLNAASDQSKFAGTIGVDHWSNPAYRVDANLDQIDLDRYFPPAEKSTAARQKSASPNNLDLTFLKHLNIDGQVRIGVFKSSGTTARNARIDMESAPKK